MENLTSFDLNHAVQNWRENLGHSPAFRSENLYELETHLRDSIAALQRQGLSAEESFLVAVNRTGKDTALELEFSKINTRTVWLDRVLWMLLGIQVWGFVSGVIGSLARIAVILGLKDYDFGTHERVIPASFFGVSQLFVFTASLAVCWWLIWRRGTDLGAWAAGLLRRHRLWHLTLIALCGLMFLPVVLHFGMPILQAKFTDPLKFYAIVGSQQYSLIAGYAIQAITFATLTLLLARKRLCARIAEH